MSRSISLTHEGWYYLLVLSFIIGGAILREVNLLVVLSGMMIGPLIFSWRWVTLTLSNLSIERRLPSRIAAGDPLVVELAVTNHRRRLTSWAIIATDTIEREFPHSTERPTRVESAVPGVRAGDMAHASYRCLITRRGRYRFGPIQLATRFPLGLVTGSERLEAADSLIVCPQQGRLNKRWEQWIDSERAGSQRSNPRRGLVDGDYYGMREWRAGDSQRWIHWRTSARLNELAVRQFEEQKNADVAILLDLWTPEKPSDGMLGNIEVVVSAGATAVADLCRRGSNMLAVAIHAAETEVCSAPASATFAQDILDRLAVAEATATDRLQAVLEQLVETSVPGARLIVFSARKIDIEARLATLPGNQNARQQATLARTVWIDVTSDDFASVFTLD